MTESVTPRAPDPPLVDPETGETPPLSPPRGEPFFANLMPLKRAIERDPRFQAAMAEVDRDLPKWWKKTFTEEPPDAA